MLSQKCKNCTFYTAYYKQWAAGYGKLNHGYCSKHEKPQTQFETCGSFLSNAKKERRKEERRLVCLEQALRAIIEIAQILKEEDNIRE